MKVSVNYFPITYEELVNDVERYHLEKVSDVLAYLMGFCKVITGVEYEHIQKLISDGFIIR